MSDLSASLAAMRETSRETVQVPLVTLLRIAAMAAEVRAGVVEASVVLKRAGGLPAVEAGVAASVVLRDADDMALALTETLRSTVRAARAP